MTYLFDIGQVQQIKEHFDSHGFVAIRQVLNEKECDATLKDIGDQMTKMSPNFNILDSSTYENAPISGNFGIYSSNPIFTKQFMLIRQHELVYKCFEILYEEKNLLISHDRCCFYRQTNLHPEWKTKFTFPGLHLDFAPKSFYDYADLYKKRELLTYQTPKDFIAENNFYCKTVPKKLRNFRHFIY